MVMLGGELAGPESARRRWHLVYPTRVPWVAPQQATQCQPGAARGAVLPERLVGIPRARGIETTARAQQRTDRHLVQPDQTEEEESHWSPPTRRRTLPRPRSSSAASVAEEQVAAVGFARTTSIEPAGSRSRCGRTRWRSRRFTWFRTTAPPTARPTTKPTRGASVRSAPAKSCTTRQSRPDRCPRRATCWKSRRSQRRLAAASTRVRPRVSRDPWHDAQ
jgi:hypothetical protein